MQEALYGVVNKHKANIAENGSLAIKMVPEMERFLENMKKDLEEGRIDPNRFVRLLRVKLGDTLAKLENATLCNRSLLNEQSSIMVSTNYNALDALEFYKRTKEMTIDGPVEILMCARQFNKAFEVYSDEIEKMVAKIQAR